MPIAENMGSSIASDLLTPEFKAMNGRDKWETLVLSGLIGTSEPWIAALTQTLRDEAEALSQLTREVDAYSEALTPSGDTKAAYHGEFTFEIFDGESNAGIEQYRKVYVPWDTTKQIMAAIRERALSRSSGRVSDATE